MATDKKLIEASKRMLKVNSQRGEVGMSPPLKRHVELELETLENAPRDAEKLERLLKSKDRQKEETMHIEDRQSPRSSSKQLAMTSGPAILSHLIQRGNQSEILTSE